MSFDVDMRVPHVAGKHNQLANCLSRGWLQEATHLHPLLQHQSYQPPTALVEAVHP